MGFINQLITGGHHPVVGKTIYDNFLQASFIFVLWIKSWWFPQNAFRWGPLSIGENNRFDSVKIMCWWSGKGINGIFSWFFHSQSILPEGISYNRAIALFAYWTPQHVPIHKCPWVFQNRQKIDRSSQLHSTTTFFDASQEMAWVVAWAAAWAAWVAWVAWVAVWEAWEAWAVVWAWWARVAWWAKAAWEWDAWAKAWAAKAPWALWARETLGSIGAESHQPDLGGGTYKQPFQEVFLQGTLSDSVGCFFGFPNSFGWFWLLLSKCRSLLDNLWPQKPSAEMSVNGGHHCL